MSGYTIQQGSCVTSTNCQPRQYIHFGQCYDVSSTCGQFDAYTGNCLTCNSTQYNLINGTCVLQITACNLGYNLLNGICVSNTCGDYNMSTGLCFNCITAAYYLTSGQCLPINCGTNMYYSVKASSCVSVPSGCTNFSITYEVCYACASGT
jgi:hypothetical protein